MIGETTVEDVSSGQDVVVVYVIICVSVTGVTIVDELDV